MTPPDAPAIRIVTDAEPESLAGFDAIIDTRSPSEFAEDHVPGAINLPVLNDAERAEIGTLYVASRFAARKRGAALVARNIARHLETALADRPADFRPLIYCWRGGQRSHAMATVLSQVGWLTTLLRGGYRTYRRHVQAQLYDAGPALKVVLIDGGTGTGKTELLHRLADLGVQTIDLEGLAEHRGSLFGAIGPQPSQKLFESRLLGVIRGLDTTRLVVVEAESSKVGDRMVPPVLWRAMQAASRIELQAPPSDRARYLVRVYGEIAHDRAALEAAFARLPIYPGRKLLANWRKLADAGDFEAIADALIEMHYDPAYERGARREDRGPPRVVELKSLDPEAIAAAARTVKALIEP